MGYDLHITRKHNWSDPTGPAIAETEWRNAIEEDPELSLDPESRAEFSGGEFVFASWKGEHGVLWWYRGEIVAKNPDELLIAKMARIARSLNASVQGDDGEFYLEDGSSFQPGSTPPSPAAPHGLISRIASWFHGGQPARQAQRGAPRFRVGDRVRDWRGGLGTVIEVDRRANHALGSVRVRFDDGREVEFALAASALEIERKPSGS
jgi:hypothetical protein